LHLLRGLTSPGLTAAIDDDLADTTKLLIELA
jgi:hypothetical protein